MVQTSIEIIFYLIKAISLKPISEAFEMPFEYNKLLKAKVPLPIQRQSSPVREINRPVTIAGFLLIQNAKILISLGNKLGTKEVTRPLLIFIPTTPPQQLHGPKRVLLPNHLLHKTNQPSMKLLFLRMA